MSKESSKIAKSAPDSLKLLWSRGFFKSWKNYGQITKSLSNNGYNFTTSGLSMALERAKHLTRRGKRGNYEYIQKYPFVKEGGEKSKNHK
ncbi:MAG: hypothetical protein WC675_03290 [Patescibacteria group bacterium]|jgi:hypothetical protein